MCISTNFLPIGNWKQVTENDLTILAVKIKELLLIPAVVFLEGNLGSGKTTFCRYFFGQANSPTYSIINTYRNGIHGDFYRLKNSTEITQLELELYKDVSYFLIEWGLSYLEIIARDLGDSFKYYLLKISIGDELLRNFDLQEIFFD